MLYFGTGYVDVQDLDSDKMPKQLPCEEYVRRIRDSLEEMPDLRGDKCPLNLLNLKDASIVGEDFFAEIIQALRGLGG